MSNRLLAWMVWPALVGAWVAAFVWVASTQPPSSIPNWLGLGSLTLVVLLVVLELVLPYRRDWSIRGDKEIWRDIGHSLLYTNIGGATAQLVFVVGAAAGMSRLGLTNGLGLWPTNAPFAIQVLLVILLGDLLEYWTHRLSHSVNWIWPLHAIHHSPVRLSTLKAARHHILYFWARGLVAWLPLMILGAPGEIIFFQVAALGTTGLLAHANIDFRIPGWIQRSVVTPSYHRIHHSVEAREGNSNFAVVLPIWDRIFGTYVDPVETPVAEVGMKHDPIPRAFMTEILSPFMYRRLARKRARARQPEWSA